MYLPLTNNPEETFSVSISEVIYTFRQLWNENGYWVLDISDADGDVLVYGVKLVTKEFLLMQYPQLSFDLISYTAGDPGRYDLDAFNLGVVAKDV